MKNYMITDYALNRVSENIVNKFVTGITEITLEDYLAENPDKTAEDFAEIKAILDSIYYEELVNTRRTTKFDISINDVHSKKLVNDTPIIDEIVKAEDTKKISEATKELLKNGNFTEIQKRRFIMHYFQGYSLREIAYLENVHFKSINESLESATYKLKKFFEKL